MRWIRPILSIMGFSAITAGFFLGMIDAAAYFGLVTGIVVWWFKSRDQAKQNGGLNDESGK